MREGIVRRKRVLWLRGTQGPGVVREPAGGNLHLPADPDPVLYIGPQDGPEGAGDGGAAGGDGGGRAGGQVKELAEGWPEEVVGGQTGGLLKEEAEGQTGGQPKEPVQEQPEGLPGARVYKERGEMDADGGLKNSAGGYVVSDTYQRRVSCAGRL